jgi:hypothetical protein
MLRYWKAKESEATTVGFFSVANEAFLRSPAHSSRQMTAEDSARVRFQFPWKDPSA